MSYSLLYPEAMVNTRFTSGQVFWLAHNGQLPSHAKGTVVMMVAFQLSVTAAGTAPDFHRIPFLSVCTPMMQI